MAEATWWSNSSGEVFYVDGNGTLWAAPRHGYGFGQIPNQPSPVAAGLSVPPISQYWGEAWFIGEDGNLYIAYSTDGSEIDWAYWPANSTPGGPQAGNLRALSPSAGADLNNYLGGMVVDKNNILWEYSYSNVWSWHKLLALPEPPQSDISYIHNTYAYYPMIAVSYVSEMGNLWVVQFDANMNSTTQNLGNLTWSGAPGMYSTYWEFGGIIASNNDIGGYNPTVVFAFVPSGGIWQLVQLGEPSPQCVWGDNMTAASWIDLQGEENVVGAMKCQNPVTGTYGFAYAFYSTDTGSWDPVWDTYLAASVGEATEPYAFNNSTYNGSFSIIAGGTDSKIYEWNYEDRDQAGDGWVGTALPFTY